MRAVTIEEFGAPDGLRLADVPDPVPGPGQVAIIVDAIGVGGVDAVIRRGMLGSEFPVGMIPGSEVAGVVSAVGRDVDPFWTGRRVWAFTGTGGGYAEKVVADVEDLILLPNDMSAIDAVTLGSAGTVAHFALVRGRLSAGESVLVRGAAGSIGIAAVELAREAAAGEIAVTTSSPERGRRLLALGATRVLDRSGADADGPAAGFDVVVDIVGGDGVPVFLDRLAGNGRYVLVGAVAGYPPADFGMTLLRSFRQSRSFATLSLATVPVAERNAVRAAQFERAARGGFALAVHEVMPLERAIDAHRAMDEGVVFGRIVLVPGSQGR